MSLYILGRFYYYYYFYYYYVFFFLFCLVLLVLITFILILFIRIAGVSYGRFIATRCKLICQRLLGTVGDR